ncbi:glyoxalase superfamily protein [Hyphobacterium sp. HN65]|uniref:Glyoxalase superfamily protein n=1 Tax=Hyphobacterium lacteum TaxID=3116575 RepID=A0ABU7LQB3_9PROT|nr:glyoxalase superfamily protein [Hyphobacterium sp. HN65]MEE2526092.1 glyoxalase superfamily protein [Hyphobacterium sp. HN65]
MTHSTPLPSLADLKAKARRLRNALAEDGDFIKHGESLELVARQYGYRDWNTLHAAAGNRPPLPLAVGGTIGGRYLGQAFKARIVALQPLGGDEAYMRISLDLDEAVDVVTFESFSAFRRRIQATIKRNGETVTRTSNGEPHLRLDLEGAA